MFLLVIGALSSCGRAPDSEFAAVNREFIQGDLEKAQKDAERGYQRFQKQPEWAGKFRILEARVAAWRGMYPDVLKILETPAGSDYPDILIAELSLRGITNAYIHNFPEAEHLLDRATEFCAHQASSSCGELLQARGLFASQQGNSANASDFYQQALAFARSHQDLFLESSALLNLAAESLSLDHFDEAIDYSQSSLRIAKILHAHVVELTDQANIGWAKYRLGDSEGALGIFLDAERLAGELGDVSDQENELTNLGYIYMDEGRLDQAEQSFRGGLDLAKRTRLKTHIYNALRVLARLSLRRGDLQKASEFADQALDLARETSDRADDLYPRLVQAQIAAKRGDIEAEATFREIEQDPQCPAFLKWEAEHSLAQLYEGQNRADQADLEYRAGITTFELARSTVRHEDSKISFLTNGASLYDDYVHFLVARQKNADALKWADFDRARALAEGLGVLRTGPRRTANDSSVSAPDLNPQAIARRANGTLFFYWLGEKQSYLWATDSSTTHLFTLPPRSDIEVAVQRYRSALNGPQDVLESGGENGRALYRMLIAPAQSMLQPNAKVYILPDGTLNNLNFETLIVPSPKPHYWIEDADVINASSLRILAALQAPTNNRTHHLLLIGDSLAVGKDYPELPKAADQMASVAKHFPGEQRRIFSRQQANPAAYLQNNPEQFSNIHFVAHGIASRLSPLDSAIVLSGDADNPSSFKLYARDIVHHRLKADLVTISACYGAGERQYSGEGLVGLAWAFLYAGSHNVIAALWDVADASTYQLMDRFYDELSKGATPDAALRAAKLSLLRGNAFHNPFYWAPFQLYAA